MNLKRIDLFISTKWRVDNFSQVILNHNYLPGTFSFSSTFKTNKRQFNDTGIHQNFPYQ